MSNSYHHGALRRAVLDRALQIIAAEGAEHLSIRSIAADLGVSHTAPRHHFGTREGLLSTIAAEGFAVLGQRLAAVRESGGSFLDAGSAYVEFALTHPAHFRVMFAPDLLDDGSAELRVARDAAFAELRFGVDEMTGGAGGEDAAAAVIAGWAIAHGIAQLAGSGNLDRARLQPLVAGGDIATIARRAMGMLYGSPERGSS